MLGILQKEQVAKETKHRHLAGNRNVILKLKALLIFADCLLDPFLQNDTWIQIMSAF